MMVIGCDPSLTCTGISDGVRTELIKTDPGPSDVHPWEDINRRVDFIIDAIVHFCGGTNCKVYVENAMTNGPRANHLLEMGAYFHALVARFTPENVVLIPPTTLKKHLAGNGGAKKKHKVEEIKPCVVCSAKTIHGVSFDKDPGADKLHAFGAWSYGIAVESGKLIHSPPKRRGQGAKQVARRSRTQKSNATDRSDTAKRNAPNPKRRSSRVAVSRSSKR